MIKDTFMNRVVFGSVVVIMLLGLLALVVAFPRLVA